LPQTLPTPPLTPGTRQSVDKAIDEVAGLIGGSSDLAVRDKAIRALDRAATYLNMWGVWLYQHTENTWTSGAATDSSTFQDKDTYLVLPSDWGWPDEGVQCLGSDGEIVGKPYWVDWFLYRNYSDNQANQESIPEIISIGSEAEGRAYVWPPIATADVSTIRVPYFRRVEKPSTVTTLTVTDEVMEALTAGAEYFVMRFRHSSEPNVYAPYWQQFIAAVRGARGADMRQRRVIRSNIIPLEAGPRHTIGGIPGRTSGPWVRLG